MKMTRLEWRYLQKIALDHPYFDTHELPLTEKEADAIVKANIRMTGKEFVDSIYAKLGMTRPSEEKKPFAWLRSIGDQFTIPPIRKIIISVLVVLLLTVFFAATPMGQAIAESVIQYIIGVFDKSAIITTNNHTIAPIEVASKNDDLDFSVYSSLESEAQGIQSVGAFVREYKRYPLVFQLPFQSIYAENEEGVSITISYQLDGRNMTTIQVWDCDESFISSVDGEFSEIQTDPTILYAEDEGDNSGIFILLYDDSVMVIYAESVQMKDRILMMINGII